MRSEASICDRDPTIFLMHGSQHLIQWNGGETCGMIGQTG
jgi:hypothetical protein